MVDYIQYRTTLLSDPDSSNQDYLNRPMTDSLADLKEILPVPVEIEILDHEKKEKPGFQWIHGLGKIHRYSAYCFLGFLGIHATSVVLVPVLPIEPGIKQDVFEMARGIYHSLPQVENVVLGAGISHVVAGMLSRILRSRTKSQNKRKLQLLQQSPIITDPTRSDIGLGGITSLLGLGFKKSWISLKIPGLSPLAFSGYILIPFLLVHFTKFRWLPISLDGDLSLINLNYITYYLNHSPIRGGNVINIFNLIMLVWLTLYHVVSGMLTFNHKYSVNWKRFGYFVINTFSAIGLFAIWKYKANTVDSTGFIATTFKKYLSAFWF